MKLYERQSHSILFCEELPPLIREMLLTHVDSMFEYKQFKIDTPFGVPDDSVKEIAFEFFRSIKHPKLGQGFILPRYVSSLIKEFYPDIEIVQDNSYWAFKPIDLVIKGNAKAGLQESAINYLLNLDGQNAVLALQTNKGKSFVSLKYAECVDSAFAVFVHKKTLVDSWIKEITTFTNITESEIAVVSGLASIDKILKNPTKYKCVIGIHRTFSTYMEDPTHRRKIVALLKELQIGIKIFDEAHLEQRSVFLIDAYTNIRQTLYLSASPKKFGDKDRILRYMIPRETISFGLNDEEREESPTTVMYSFIDTKPPLSQQKIVSRANGVDIVSYNKYVEKYGFLKIMEQLVSYIRRIHDTANYKRQIVIVAGTCEAVKKIKKYLEEIFYNCEIGDFSSNVVDVRERLKNLRDSDIVVTTDKSFTDGENSNVEVVFNLVPVAYGNKHTQMVGRLRKFKTHHIAVFVNIIDIGFIGILKMAKESCDGFKSASKEVKKIRPEFLTDLSYHYKEDLINHFTYN